MKKYRVREIPNPMYESDTLGRPSGFFAEEQQPTVWVIERRFLFFWWMRLGGSDTDEYPGGATFESEAVAQKVVAVLA